MRGRSRRGRRVETSKPPSLLVLEVAVQRPGTTGVRLAQRHETVVGIVRACRDDLEQPVPDDPVRLLRRHRPPLDAGQVGDQFLKVDVRAGGIGLVPPGPTVVQTPAVAHPRQPGRLEPRGPARRRSRRPDTVLVQDAGIRCAAVLARRAAVPLRCRGRPEPLLEPVSLERRLRRCPSSLPEAQGDVTSDHVQSTQQEPRLVLRRQCHGITSSFSGSRGRDHTSGDRAVRASARICRSRPR